MLAYQTNGRFRKKLGPFFMQTRTVLVGVTRAGALNARKDRLGEREEQETKGTAQGGKKLLSTVLFFYCMMTCKPEKSSEKAGDPAPKIRLALQSSSDANANEIVRIKKSSEIFSSP